MPIYAAGAAHTLKQPCRAIVNLAAGSDNFVTDAEVLQEMIHRYRAIGRWAAGRAAFSRFLTVMTGRIESMLETDVEQAAILADRFPRLSSRDLVHAAVMYRIGVRHIVTADSGFDELRGIELLDPAQVDSWQDRVLSSA